MQIITKIISMSTSLLLGILFTQATAVPIHVIIQNNTLKIIKVSCSHTNTQQAWWEQRKNSIGPMERKPVLWIGSRKKDTSTILVTTDTVQFTLKQEINPLRETIRYAIRDEKNNDLWAILGNKSQFIKTHFKNYNLSIAAMANHSPQDITIVYTFQEIPSINNSISSSNNSSNNSISNLKKSTNLDIVCWDASMYRHSEGKQRVIPITNFVPLFDIAIICGLFDYEAQQFMQKKLRKTFPYQTPSQAYFLNSTGIVIFSKWPIKTSEPIFFKTVCHGTDCQLNKGFVYARIDKNGMSYNLIGANLQSWQTNIDALTRQKQLSIIKDYVRDKKFSHQEPLLIIGNLGINRYKSALDNKKLHEYTAMLALLKAHHPQQKGHPYTVDSSLNSLTNSADPKEYTDYLLYLTDYKTPSKSWNWVIPYRDPLPWYSSTKRTLWDPSPHYPVWGHFEF